MRGIYIYKCRRCGKQYSPQNFCQTGDLDESLRGLANASNHKQSVAIHECDAEQVGIADLVGGDYIGDEDE